MAQVVDKAHIQAAPLGDDESDYGSDIDNDTWDHLTAPAESQPLADVAIQSIEDPLMQRVSQQTGLFLLGARNGYENSALTARAAANALRASSPATLRSRDVAQHRAFATARAVRTDASEAEVRASDHESEALPFSNNNVQIDTAQSLSNPPDRQHSLEPDPTDTRTPLQRFRTPPKKPLSVTDIVSPAWCELQYWYSLTKYGRTRRTPAMKQGSKIHKEKEREVHVEVPVETVSPEDRFGLRLWNIIQGLRTLRSTGLTRELEVIGVIDGEVIIGVIDEVNRTCPDEEMEISLFKTEASAHAQDGATKSRKKKSDSVPANQKTLTAMFSQGNDQEKTATDNSWLGSIAETSTTLYLVDIKTRKSRSLPSLAQMRPTRMQLMLYRKLLLSLASNSVEAHEVFKRYQLDSDCAFSDTFIAALGSLESAEEGGPSSLPATQSSTTSMDFLDEITAHNTLSQLWTLMIAEFEKTIPAATKENSDAISPMLTAEFRSSDHGELIGKRCFPVDASELEQYTREIMKWWTGERAARGVDVEEAYKCGFCEFASTCTWRAEKLQEAGSKRLQRSAAGPAIPAVADGS